MKASEFIERIQQLMEVANGDPEVLVETDHHSFESAAIELSNVKKMTGIGYYQSREMDNDIQVLTIY